tara:strand:+ start:200 stop:919 length:720 start_codon:yes stop_codon:yes gene_type:complete
MIQGIFGQFVNAYIQTEDNRINTSVSSSHIRYLYKFTNDMDKSVQYVYGLTEDIYDRYTHTKFRWGCPLDALSVYAGTVCFDPAGFYKYEVFEVSWIGTIDVTKGNAPITENDTLLPAANDKGIVQGLVTKGKMYISEATGSEEVQYIQNAKSVQTLTIANGGVGYTSIPTITITGGGSPITTATATCTLTLGVVTSVTITNAGSGYTQNPSVVLSTSGSTEGAEIIADINQTNYIYTG